MAQASATVEIPATPEEVWELIGGFGSLPDWLPYIPESKLTAGGLLRHLANPGGEAIIERLEHYDNANWTYSYSILQSPFPISRYVATLRVQVAADGKASRVVWCGDFDADGVSDEQVCELFGGIYRDGLKALAARYGVS